MPSILMGDLKEVAPSGVIPNLEVDAIDEVLFDQDRKVDKNLALQILANASIFSLISFTNAIIFNLVNISQD